MRQRAFCLAAILVAGAFPASAQEKKPTTPQGQRGLELFLRSPKGTACGTCHTMAGVGTAVGPDLTPIATAAQPGGLVSVIQMQLTAYVQEVTTADGAFPGIQKLKQGDNVEIWDLSQKPPVLRKLKSSDIVSMNRDQKWKHPPTSAGYTTQELADIIGFLKWAATGSTREIKASDLE